MDPIESHIDPSAESFRTNLAHMERLVEQLKERRDKVRDGGGPRYVERHREQGKLPVRERIDKLLDLSLIHI